jgi:hypothetical protein
LKPKKEKVHASREGKRSLKHLAPQHAKNSSDGISWSESTPMDHHVLPNTNPIALLVGTAGMIRLLGAIAERLTAPSHPCYPPHATCLNAYNFLDTRIQARAVRPTIRIFLKSNH